MPTVRKWLGRLLAGGKGKAALADASSRPHRSPRAIAPATALLMVELRQRCLLQARIPRSVGVSAATVSRGRMRAGISKLADLTPLEPVQRYEHEAPGDLPHIDIKKFGRIVRPGHRVTGDPRDSVDGAIACILLALGQQNGARKQVSGLGLSRAWARPTKASVATGSPQALRTAAKQRRA